MDHSLLRTSLVKLILLRTLAALLCLGCFLLAANVACAEVSEACVTAYESAQELRLSGQYLDARKNLLVCAQSSCPALLRRDCTTWLSEMEASTPTVVFAFTDSEGHDLSNVRIYEQGQLLEQHAAGRALALDPGAHTLRFEADGHQAVEQSLTIREAEKNRIVRAELPVLEQPGPLERAWSRLSVPTLALTGSALLSAGAFIGFAVDGKRQYNELEESCGKSCPESRTERGRRDYVIANVALASTLGFAAAALWTYVAIDRRPSPAATALQLRVSPSEAAVALDYRF